MNTNSHILVIDDDTRIRDLLKAYLCGHNYIVSTAQDTDEARKILEMLKVDLIILDIMMPKENGIEFAKILRQTSQVAILMLTAMGDVEERITGLLSGADDYMAKPFEPRELLIRIEKLIRNKQFTLDRAAGKIVYFNNISFNLDTNLLCDGDQIIPLSFGEAKLLKILCENINTPITREKLAQLCDDINERSVDVQITRLRSKIEPDKQHPRFIQTIRGKGYALFTNNKTDTQ